MGLAFIGIDVGTFETKGVLVNEAGKILALSTRRHEISTPAPGYVEQDAEKIWWVDVCEVSNQLAKTLTASPDLSLAGIGVSGIGPCVACLDADFEPLRPAILYGVDIRAQSQIDQLNRRFGEEVIFERTGNNLSSQSGTPKIAWVRDNEPAVFAATRWFCTCQSYLVAKMTGEVTMDRYTASYYHLLYDVESGEWTNNGLEDLIDVERLPRLVWANEVVGQLLESAAAQMGLPPGVPVIAGTSDAGAEAISCSVTKPGDMMIMYGSSTYMIEVTDHLVQDSVLWSTPYLLPGLHSLAAGTSTAGTATRWLCDLLGLSAKAGDGAMFDQMVELAEEAQVGSEGVLFVPHMSGERTPVHNPSSRGTLIGLNLSTGRAQVARAVIEGIGHSIAHALDRYREVGEVPKCLYAVGGGTKNSLLLETVASLCGADQTVVKGPGAAFGDAMLAANGTGSLPLAKFDRWATFGATIRTRDVPELRTAHEEYIDVYERMAPFYSERKQ